MSYAHIHTGLHVSLHTVAGGLYTEATIRKVRYHPDTGKLQAKINHPIYSRWWDADLLKPLEYLPPQINDKGYTPPHPDTF